VTGAHIETCGNLISEAFHAHCKFNKCKFKKNTKETDAKKASKTSSTAAQASEWGVVTSVHSNDFFKTKK